MKLTILIAVAITTFNYSFAADAPAPEPDIASEIIKAKVQGFSHALVELKLREIKLNTATPIDNDMLASIRAQEAAINQELLKLTLAPLQATLEEALKSYQEGHRIIIELRKEIEKKTMEFRGTAP